MVDAAHRPLPGARTCRSTTSASRSTTGASTSCTSPSRNGRRRNNWPPAPRSSGIPAPGSSTSTPATAAVNGARPEASGFHLLVQAGPLPPLAGQGLPRLQRRRPRRARRTDPAVHHPDRLLHLVLPQGEALVQEPSDPVEEGLLPLQPRPPPHAGAGGPPAARRHLLHRRRLLLSRHEAGVGAPHPGPARLPPAPAGGGSRSRRSPARTRKSRVDDRWRVAAAEGAATPTTGSTASSPRSRRPTCGGPISTRATRPASGTTPAATCTSPSTASATRSSTKAPPRRETSGTRLGGLEPSPPRRRLPRPHVTMGLAPGRALAGGALRQRGGRLVGAPQTSPVEGRRA